MTFEEMQSFLNGIQAEKTQTKIMNALLSCYQQVKTLEKLVIELQEKVNQIAKNWNEEIEGVSEDGIEDASIQEIIEENAAPVQQEEDATNNDITAASLEQLQEEYPNGTID